ncbi:laminin subunit alpha-5-like [Gymnodraco acuticeps]|uniref:Laminin subunit alpha-5-like n=1 Tax=Gymnodraco acuticeps TaxID=8218 RepID=A0A6P8V7D3_GYMAC|nr:laminin subunit alpha-5-like [Gymnodraco acuticeps]
MCLCLFIICQYLQSQLGTKQKRLHPVTEITKDLLKNITNIFVMLDETKKEFENHAAEVDGAKWKLFQKLNNIFQMKATMGSVTKAEEHAEELSRVAAEFQPLLHNVSTISDDLLSELGIGVYNSIINAKDNAEMAASQSREAAERALMDAKEAGLVNMAKGLKDKSTHLWTEANETLKMQSQTMNILKDGMKKKMEKGELLRMGISTVSDNLKNIRKGLRIT